MSDPTLCHYSALGLKKDATLTDIKKAFRKLALEFHPDKVQGEEAKEASSKKFQKVNEAYSILSDEEKRQEYDDRVKLNELRRRAKGEANISAPRTPTSQHYDVRYAEPRPDTFRAKSTTRTTSSSAGTKFYSPYPPSSSRLYEDDLYASRQYEEMARTARRQPSYDDKPSKREEERERERRRKDDQDEKNIRAAERKEKERRADKEAAKKLKEKQRRRDGEEKRTHRGEPYLEEDDSLRTSKLDKKKSSSSSKKHDDRDKREKSMPRELVHEEVPDKSAQYMMEAAQYINASRSKVSNPPPLSRSSTFQDYHRRSSDTPKVRDRSTHKKSGSGSREYIETPPIIIAGHPRIPPHLGKAGSTPPKVPDSPPRQQKLGRAQTLREADFPRAPPSQPPLSRSSTYHYGEFESREPRGRDRSRYQAQVLSEDSDSEEDRRYESRRDRRHRTHSPEFVGHPTDYPPPPPRTSATRYSVKKEGRGVPMTSEPVPVYYYPEGASPPSRKAKATSYYEPYGRTPETRPPMPSRGSGYSSSGGYVPHKIKTAQSYTQDDIQYSQMAYQEAAYGY